MATKKKERFHKTGKSNKQSCYLNLSHYSSASDYEIGKREHHKNNWDSEGNHSFVLNYNGENNKNVNYCVKYPNKLMNRHINEQEKFLKIGKSEKKHINEEFVDLPKTLDDEKSVYFKGTPCKFKQNKCKKKINATNLTVHDNTNDKIEKKIDITELWNYLSHVHNSGGNRLRYKFNEIIDTRNDKHKKEMQNNTCGGDKDRKNVPEGKGGGGEREDDNFNYDEYKSMVKYILPSMSDNKIKYSWCVLKNNLKCEKDIINYKEFSNFINAKGGNDENSYVNKIVCSKLKNKMLKYNFNPSDVKLKTINYIDNVRLKASEFSKHFKELMSEKELTSLFQGREKIKIDELEKCIMEIIEERVENIEPVGGKNSSSNHTDQVEQETCAKKKKEGLTKFNMKAYISTLLSNKNNEILVEHFIHNLNIDYEMLHSQNKSIKDAYDFYSRSIPPTEVVDEFYSDELNKEEIKRAKFLIEEIDYSVRNNFKSNYVSSKNSNKIDSENSYLSLYEIFKHLDIDKDSYITKEDLHKSFQKLKIKNITNTDVNIFLKYIDIQKKGYINVNDFLTNYQLEEKSMINWIKNTNKPYFEFVKNLKREKYNPSQNSRQRATSEHVLTNKNAYNANKYNNVIKNYNLELDPFCPSYVIRERIRENFMAKKDDFLNKHLKATRFHLTGHKNTSNIVQPIESSDLYMSDNLRFKTTYNLNYNKL
ncbi:hypothetical protein, conserved [Plasmodium gonderi]|uniref:EF-hand domain-containing protein n=1 Tax=Plasmodium gonderi TaxID=77519 RepID=A0A1Y1JL52_PLAGO|nr:hypothetical protein, conserved [Plasmodium gonderi]GAW81143.1 hypothetical protein, conserved [Plasmodium gonderi]